MEEEGNGNKKAKEENKIEEDMKEDKVDRGGDGDEVYERNRKKEDMKAETIDIEGDGERGKRKQGGRRHEGG